MQRGKWKKDKGDTKEDEYIYALALKRQQIRQQKKENPCKSLINKGFNLMVVGNEGLEPPTSSV